MSSSAILPPLPQFAQRDAVIAAFRRRVYAHHHITWFPHQADWQLATEGWQLLPVVPGPGDTYTRVLLPLSEAAPEEHIFRKVVINEIACAEVARMIVPRVYGPAHVTADLAAYKAGKSYSGALWMSGFAIVPHKIHIVGFEYSTSEPEFEYLCDFLLSERDGKPPLFKATKLLNSRAQGKMLLVLPTGCQYEVKTWERKEALKGKKVLAYYYAEAYQLPGLEVFTTVAQNLRELHGFAAFTTTPDQAWVQVFHDQGHGKDPDWHCTCCVDGLANPFTFDQKARDRDNPDKGGIMTRERYAIAWCGKLGHFVGRVYDVARGERIFSPLTHPQMWKPSVVKAMMSGQESGSDYAAHP